MYIFPFKYGYFGYLMLNFTGGKIHWTLIAEHPCASRIFPKNRSSKILRWKRWEERDITYVSHVGVYSTRCCQGSKNLALRRNWGENFFKNLHWVTNKKLKVGPGVKTNWMSMMNILLTCFISSFPSLKTSGHRGRRFPSRNPHLFNWLRAVRLNYQTQPFNILGWFQCSCKTLVELDHFSK